VVGRAGIDNQVGLDQRLGAQAPAIRVRLASILADDPDENAAGAEAGNVARDIARTPRR